MRARGEGCVYQRGDSRFWWIKYSRNGKPFRQATEFLVDCGSGKRNATARKNAESLLKQKLAEIKTNTFIPPSTEKIKVSELADDFLRDYRTNNRKSIGHAEFRWNKHLQPFFGHLRAADVSSTDISRYVDERQQAGASNATINRELAALKRMFRLGAWGTPPKVQRVPKFPRLKENAPRTGFLTDEQRAALARECAKAGLWMRTMFEVGVSYGWRSSEVKGLLVRNVDLAAGTIRLDPGATKNGQGRLVTFSKNPALRELLTACVVGKKADAPVFARENRKGPIKNFRKTWQNCCCAAGVGKMVCAKCGTEECDCEKETRAEKYVGLCFHDLRRTFARNGRRDGGAESVIMKIGGWLTAAVFRRYDIVTEDDITDALAKMEAARVARESRFGHVSDSPQQSQQPQVPKPQAVQ